MTKFILCAIFTLAAAVLGWGFSWLLGWIDDGGGGGGED